jgi:hypothetical protein
MQETGKLICNKGSKVQINIIDLIQMGDAQVTRITEKTVTFIRPFFLTALGEDQAAGTYTIETEEELLQDVSYPAYRRVATRIYLHTPGDDRITGIATIDPEELDEALSKDSQA